MNALPTGWRVERLDAVAEVRLGRQRSPKNHIGDQMRPYLRAANVDWDGLRLDDVKTMNFTDAEMDVYRLAEGDLLLNEASGSPREVGKPALWRGEIDDCAFQNTLIRVRPRNIGSEFLLHYFRYAASTGKFAEASRGVGINHLGREALASWLTPVPPREVQERVVALLDRADALRTKRHQTVDMLEQLIDSIFIHLFNPDIPGLPVKSLGELIKLKSGSFLPASAMKPGGAYPVYGGNGVSGQHDDFLFEDEKIVIGRVGVYCGCVHVAPPKSWVTDNALYVADISDEITPFYLAHALRRANLNQYSSKSAQPLISGSRISGALITVPPLPMQDDFRAKVLAVDAAKKQQVAQIAQLDQLFEALRDRAFRGEL